EGAGLQLNNQSWWEINGLEITSGAPHKLDVRRGGIMAYAEGEEGKIEHIYIQNCYIHDIWGQVGGNKSGIAIYVGEKILGQSSFNNCPTNDILIENNTIKRVDKIGIAVNGDDQVVIRGNYLENLGGDGIIVIGAHRAMIERNIADRTCLRSGDPDLDTGGEDWWPHTAAIWLWKNTETVMQYNEVYNTGRQAANGDGFAYDFDFDCSKCVLQYNYSANNHGFLLIMSRAYDNIARYNISQNDQTHLIQIHGHTEDRNLIHNNVFYVDHSTVDLDYYCGMEDEKDKNKLGVSFKNNIFYAGGQGRFRTVYTHGSSLDRQFNDSVQLAPDADGPVFQNNCFYGPWLNGMPADPQSSMENPGFREAGSGGIGRSSLSGYQLLPTSPCINRGVWIEGNTQKDFFGNPILDQKTDIGVWEQDQ
ncbi:MAG: right-handed parallel beta-helix repeat-containing protein, partial [Bacteroidota bacterium]